MAVPQAVGLRRGGLRRVGLLTRRTAHSGGDTVTATKIDSLYRDLGGGGGGGCQAGGFKPVTPCPLRARSGV
jgi:hypothetical protein